MAEFRAAETLPEAALAALETLTDNTYQSSSKTSSRTAVNRRRFDFLARNSGLLRQRGCMRQTVNGIALIMDRGGRWRCSGLMRCSRVDCPECGIVLLTERQNEIETAADRWVRFHGGTLAFLTFTFSHRASEAFATASDVRAAAWKFIGDGPALKRDNKRYGIAGMIRVNEDTWGDVFGWHCHIHVLMFLESAPGSPESVAAIKGIGAAFFKRWRFGVVKLGRKASKLGFDAHEVSGSEGARAMGDYLTKQLDVPKRELGAAMARELVGAGVKSAGRKVDSAHYSVTDLLDLAMAGDERAAALYLDREIANKGRRSIAWSNGLRERVGLREADTDAEVAAVDDLGRVEDRLVFSIPQRAWSKLRRLRYGMGRLCEVGETNGDVAAADYLTALGVDFEHGAPHRDREMAAFMPPPQWNAIQMKGNAP